MSRERLAIGTYGEILVFKAKAGTYRARTRFRDWDGVSRLVQATGETRRKAESTLKQKLTERQEFLPGDGDLTGDSLFSDLVAYWLADLDAEGRLAISTRQRYEQHMRQLVLPAFGNLMLREIGVARCDRFVKSLLQKSYNRARQAKVVMRLAFGLAVRHEIVPRNPMDGIARLHKPQHTPEAMEAAQVNEVRTAIAFWEMGLSASGPKPDGQLGVIVEVMLGTSARIGEALAIRIKDLDLAGPMPSIAIRGTIATPSGQAPYRQDHPKTARSNRIVAIPQFCVDAVRRRLSKIENPEPDSLLFSSRNGTPLTMANVRRQLRAVMKLAGIEGVTPHLFRRTVATAIYDNSDVELAAELLGHANTKITVEHYIRRRQMVNPITATLLQQSLAPDR
jgi:integrase